MNLIECLRRECVQTGLSASDKDGVLKEIANLARRCDLLEPYKEEQIYRALKDREAVGSTAFGGGIAIPHCALKDIDDFVVGLINVPDGVDFESSSGEPTRLITFIIGPAEKRNEHVTLLSAISRVLDDPDTVEELVRADNAEVLTENFLRHHRGHIPHQDRERCLFHVVIQDESVFNDILQVFSGAVEGDISVIESHNAGHYLDRLPMFAAFWSEHETGFCRIVIAVVDKALSNDVVRRINVVVKDLEHRSGVLVTVHELMLVRGSLDF